GQQAGDTGDDVGIVHISVPRELSKLTPRVPSVSRRTGPRQSTLFDLTTVIAVSGAFLVAGAVKGVIGLGLPMVSLGLLTVALDLQTAMALLVVPSFVTNLWQAVVGGNAKFIVHRLWPFLATASMTVWIGVAALARLNPSLLTALLGAQLV